MQQLQQGGAEELFPFLADLPTTSLQTGNLVVLEARRKQLVPRALQVPRMLAQAAAVAAATSQTHMQAAQAVIP